MWLRFAILLCSINAFNLSIASASSSTDTAQVAPKLIQPIGDGGFVVEASVVAVKSNRVRLDETRFHESFVATMKISHVYCGRPDAIGAEFVAPCEKEPEPRFSGFTVKPPLLRVGEIGLWVVRGGPGGRLGAVLQFGLGDHVWPLRKGISPRYNEATKLARTIEMVARAPTRADQLRLTQGFATSSTPGVSMWAIELLSRVEPGGWTIEETVNFLDGLVENGRLPMAGQAALDNSLLKLRKAEWQKSPRRLQLLQKWVSARLAAEEADEMVAQLSLLAQHPNRVGLEIEKLLPLFKTAVENEGLPLASRCAVLDIAGTSMPVRRKRFDDDRPAFDFLVDVVKRGNAPELRVKAASWLGVFLTTDTEWRWSVVNELRRTSADEKLSDALDRSLRPPEKKKLPKSLDVNRLE